MPLPPASDYIVRHGLSISQAELARRAGIRVETLNRIERAKMTRSMATMGKIDWVLEKTT